LPRCCFGKARASRTACISKAGSVETCQVLTQPWLEENLAHFCSFGSIAPLISQYPNGFLGGVPGGVLHFHETLQEPPGNPKGKSMRGLTRRMKTASIRCNHMPRYAKCEHLILSPLPRPDSYQTACSTSASRMPH